MAAKPLEDVIKEVCYLLYEGRADTTSQRDIVNQVAWLLFLKYLELPEIERQHTVTASPYGIDSLGYHWDEWVPDILNIKTPQEGQHFLRNELLPHIERVFDLKRDYMQINTSFDVFKHVLRRIHEEKLNLADWEDSISVTYSILFQSLTGENKAMGIFATPPPVAHFMTQVLNPGINDIVYDPACGTGDLLITACKHACNTGTIHSNQLFGRDSAEQIVQLARMNIVLHGVAPKTIQQQDVSYTPEQGSLPSLHTEVPPASVILTHPPLGVGDYSPTIASDCSEQALDCYEAWFLRHSLRKLTAKSYARCGMVVSDVMLNGNQGLSQRLKMQNTAQLRKKLLQDWNILMIICLPKNTFGPLSSKQTYLLFFDNRLPTGKILYYNLASRLNYKPYTPARPIKDQDFQEVLTAWEQWKTYLKDPDNTLEPAETDYQTIATYEPGLLDHRTSESIYSIPIPHHYKPSEEELIAPDKLVMDLQENCKEMLRLTQRLREILYDHNSKGNE